MKKQNQIERKNSRTSHQSQLQVRQLPVFTMDQLERMTSDPATAKIERFPRLSRREIHRLLVIPLSAGQARKLGPGFPTLKTFLPLATDLQLVQLLGAIPVQWSRKEIGPRRGEVTLMALVNPTEAELPAALAARRRALISKEIASRKDLTKMIKQVEHIETHASPALLRKFHRTIEKMSRNVGSNAKLR
jgi:hypothetical protein